MSTCTDCQTSFMTFYGTGIQGMWITWKNTAADLTGTIDTNTKLDVDFDLRMYGVGLDTAYFPADTNKSIYAGGNQTYQMKYYLLFNNPYVDEVASNAAGGKSSKFADLAYDGVVANIAIVTAGGSAGSTKDTAVFDWTGSNLADSKCTGEDLANCTDDTAASQWSSTTTGNQCTEIWNLTDPHIRCVRVQSTGTRKFLTDDTNAEDIDLAYRPFMVTAGWEITTTTATTTFTQKFTRQVVDFEEFLQAAPESNFNGAR